MLPPESTWLYHRLKSVWPQSGNERLKQASHSATGNPRTAVVKEQYIETIGGGSITAFSLDHDPTSKPQVLSPSRLPLELLIQIVLIAAGEVIHQELKALPDSQLATRRLLELASINRACYTSILSEILLPKVHLYGAERMRSFLKALEANRCGFRNIARARVRAIALRHERDCSQNGKEARRSRPALFDATSAQIEFEKECMPLIRVILRHCQSVEELDLEGVPRGLKISKKHEGQYRSQLSSFETMSTRIRSFSCFMGQYGGELDNSFWLRTDDSPSKWSRLTHLQLHGPRFRLNHLNIAAIGQLPQLTHLALIVPALAPPSRSNPSTADLDAEGRPNPLQTLLERSANLRHLLVVGHAEKDFVGYSERYRYWLRSVRQPRSADRMDKVKIELVTVLPFMSRSDRSTPATDRIHPAEVSRWMMDRAEVGLQWSFEPSPSHNAPLWTGHGLRCTPFEHCLESWDACSPQDSTRPSNDGIRPTHPILSQQRSEFVDASYLLDNSEDSA